MKEKDNKHRKLTIKQEKFCLKYHECGNASEAYRYAYVNSEKWKEKTVWERASVLSKNNKVITRVKELQEEQKSKSDITKERVLTEYAKIAFTSIASMHNTWINRKDFEKLSPDEKSSIKSINTRIRRVIIDEQDIEIEEIKIELYDKIRALDSISKMLGFNEPEKMDLDVNLINPSKMTDEEIMAEIARLEKIGKK